MKRRGFRCLGCGSIAGVFLEDHPAGLAGTVFHLKPEGDANVRSVRCMLYQSLSAEDFARLHEGQDDLDMPHDSSWQLCKNPASLSYVAEWLASQFRRPEQLRAYFDLGREERLACFPPATPHLEALDHSGWTELGRLAMQVMEERIAKGVPN